MDPYNASRSVAHLWLEDAQRYVEAGDTQAALDKLRIIESKVIEMELHREGRGRPGSAPERVPYVTFEEQIQDKGRKTKTWEVRGARGQSDLIGVVKWYGAWRCYGFFPAANCVFEKICLHDIARFCEAKTIYHRARK